MQTGLVLTEENVLVGIAAAFRDFDVWQIGVAQEVLRLQESPVKDKTMKALTGEEFYGVAQLSVIYLKLLGYILRI